MGLNDVGQSILNQVRAAEKAAKRAVTMCDRGAAFTGAKAKLTIASVDDSSLQVDAQYNPKELQVDQPITWNQHQPGDAEATDPMFLEFGGVQPQTTKLELLFDGYEGPDSVMDQINLLKQLAAVRDPGSTNAEQRRPHFCIVSWGRDMPSLKCVIDSLSIKYTMFASNGTVLRATVTVSVKEANKVTLAKNNRPTNRVAKPSSSTGS